MVQLQYLENGWWLDCGEPWNNEAMAWASLGGDDFNYRTIDETGKVLTDKSGFYEPESTPLRPVNKIPRRNILSKNTAAELVITDAINAVEKAGAHPELTRVVTMLQDAKSVLSDYVDGVPAKAPVKIDFTRPEVITVLDELLERPGHLRDATENENTNWNGETLLDFALLCIASNKKG